MIQPLRHIYNDPNLDKNTLSIKLVTLKMRGLITVEEFMYLQHLIIKDNKNV